MRTIAFALLILWACQPEKEVFAQEILVFSKTGGFRHKSIEPGKEALRKMSEKNKWKMTFSEDSTIFNTEALKAVKVVVFLNTTGNILNEDQQKAFEAFIQRGGGFVGIHAAADTEYDWPWYGQLVGGYFKSHPKTQQASIKVIDRKHPSTKHLEPVWTRTDEWYNYKEPIKSEYRVLAEVDESSYEGGGMGDKHPIVWCHEFDGGRAFYTGLGHTDESFSEEAYLTHLEKAILWAMGKK